MQQALGHLGVCDAQFRTIQAPPLFSPDESGLWAAFHVCRSANCRSLQRSGHERRAGYGRVHISRILQNCLSLPRGYTSRKL